MGQRNLGWACGALGSPQENTKQNRKVETRKKFNFLSLACEVVTCNTVSLWQQQQQQQHSLFFQASWGRLELKPERNKFKVQAH